MPNDIQSIEDLINATKGASTEESAQAKLQVRQQEIKTKSLERATQARAAAMGIGYINLYGFPVSPEALMLMPEDQAVELGALCFYYDGKSLRMGALNPEDTKVRAQLEDLVKRYFCDGELYLISSHSLEYALKLYRTLPKVMIMNRNLEVKEEDLNRFSEKFTSFHDLQALIDAANVTDIVTMIMAASIKSNASDIHIETEEDAIKVRFRIDGVLHDSASIGKELWKKIISRLKVLAKVKINIADKPQDGRLSIQTVAERIDIRASFLPTNFGESVVMRLLRASAVGLAFEDLGIRGRAYEQLKREITRPNGMIITTGPTGSGKTTTLYAILKKLNDPQTKIITIEDPIEYQLSGINQSQTSEKYTFAAGLKSIVRQDPDVIMVGEIRDLDTAEIAIQAALTGHLVLSTIHTNDAAGTVPRFLSMGAKPFLLAPAMNAMVGQRLIRLVCPKCKEQLVLDKFTADRIAETLKTLPEEERAKLDLEHATYFHGAGCDACQGIGYKGRIGIYEIMTINEEIQKLILNGQASEYDMRAAGARNGMITMVQDGLLKALEGLTTVEEVFRVAE